VVTSRNNANVISCKSTPRLFIRRLIVATCVSLMSAAAWTQTPAADDPAQPAPAAKTRVYALLAAMGEQFTVVTEVSRTGTHLAPYQRHMEQFPHNMLNAVALHSMDEAVVRVDPNSKRSYMTAPVVALDRVAPAERETVVIEQIKHALEAMPQRAEWDRIVVAMPAYRALELDGLSSKLQGFGLFAQTQCQAGCGGFDQRAQLRALDPEPPDGVDAITSEDKPIKARTFLAPFSYIAIWILDPKTLAVLDRQEGFNNQKLAQPLNKPLDVSTEDGQKYIAMRISNLIDFSIGEAVSNSVVNARRGVVEHGPVKEVQPEDEPKQ
jgi:hypothetical protein